MVNSQSKPEFFSLFNDKDTILYVESEFQPLLNDFISKSYKEIRTFFREQNLNFYYIPRLLSDHKYREALSYNRPYLHHLFIEKIKYLLYSRLISGHREQVSGAALLLLKKEDNFMPSQILPLDDNVIVLSTFFEKCNLFIEKYKSEEFLRLTVQRSDFLSRKDFKESMTCYYKDDLDAISYESIIEKPEPVDADSRFEIDAYVIEKEILERISQLREYGSLEVIGRILDEVLSSQRRLSSLFISKNYNIYLKDYEMKEVKMTPLPKSLFLLFLNHPEGILFKDLSDYHDELLSIYMKVSQREDVEAMMSSIKAMTDPLNNSVNEKCSRIRSAFLEVITDDLAKNYYITGKRGEPKKITLDRKLVHFQK